MDDDSVAGPKRRAEQLFAGLLGASGVAAAAASAHGSDDRLFGAVALVALTHAAAFAAFAALPSGGRARRAAIALIGAGAMLFCGDLALRALDGVRLFPMAAPTGGVAMIAGWLGVAATALIRR